MSNQNSLSGLPWGQEQERQERKTVRSRKLYNSFPERSISGVDYLPSGVTAMVFDR